MTDRAVAELAPHVGVRAACRAVGAAQAGYYRRHRHSPPPQRPAPLEHRERVQPRALSLSERQAILEQLHSDRFVDHAPAQVWATLLDEGVYLGSISTFYRLLRQAGETRCCGSRRLRPRGAANTACAPASRARRHATMWLEYRPSRRSSAPFSPSGAAS